MTKKSLLALTVSAVAVISIAAGSVAAAPDYAGRTVRVLVPSGSGGTYHVYCQLVARNIGKFIPGNPKVVTQNMPGAGGAKASRYMVNVAPKDGSIIAMINPGAITIPLTRPGIGFDTTKMHWLGSMSARAYVIAVWHTAPATTLAGLLKKQVIMGTTGKSSTSYLLPSFINKTLGTKMKIITGYKGGGAINLAIERGEVQGRGNFYAGFTGVRPHWLTENKLRFIFKMGPDRPELKNVPTLKSAMKNQLQRDMLKLLEVSFNVGQAFYLPPGAPKDVIATYRKSFAKLLVDPATQAEAASRRVPMRTLTAVQVEQKINNAFKTPDKAVKTLSKLLGFDKKRKKKKKK